MPQQDPRTVVRSSQQTWSETVARANAIEGEPTGPTPEVSYEFSGGKTFYARVGRNPYTGESNGG